MAKRKRRKQVVGDLEGVRAALWEAIEMLRYYIVKPHEAGEAVDVGEMCRMANALAAVANSYKGFAEAAVLEEIQELRGEVAEIREAHSRTQIRA